MAIIRSLWTDIPAHEVAQRFMNTGSLQLPKPSLGSWVVYGLGTENQNMPGFITHRRQARSGGRRRSCRACIQGVNVNYSPQHEARRGAAEHPQPVHPAWSASAGSSISRSKLNDMHAEALQKDAQLEARIEAFEMAFKMQTEATDAFDITKEPGERSRTLYGKTRAWAAKLLVARRLVERGVRFVQVEHGGWDHPRQSRDGACRARAGEIDGPAAALIKDLKQRGLLDERSSSGAANSAAPSRRIATATTTPGRDHNGRAMCAWMAGGGVKGGTGLRRDR